VRSEQYRQTLEKVINALRDEFGESLRAIGFTGSRANGREYRSSDLDLIVIIRGNQRQRRNIVVDGFEVEMFINPEPQIEENFASDVRDGRGIAIHMFMTCEVLFDREQCLAQLIVQAKQLWDAGPDPLGPSEVWRHRYHAADLLRDLEDAAHDNNSSTSAYIEMVLLRHAVETLYRIMRRWRPKHKGLLADLFQWDRAAGELINRYFSALPGERYEVLERLASHCLIRVGGVMPIAWRSDWESVGPSRGA
jgi:predicted nucleotidyltransferase